MQGELTHLYQLDQFQNRGIGCCFDQAADRGIGASGIAAFEGIAEALNGRDQWRATSASRTLTN